MFCSNCGKQIEESSAFCKYCGAPVHVVKKTEATAREIKVFSFPRKSLLSDNLQVINTWFRKNAIIPVSIRYDTSALWHKLFAMQEAGFVRMEIAYYRNPSATKTYQMYAFKAANTFSTLHHPATDAVCDDYEHWKQQNGITEEVGRSKITVTYDGAPALVTLLVLIAEPKENSRSKVW